MTLSNEWLVFLAVILVQGVVGWLLWRLGRSLDRPGAPRQAPDDAVHDPPVKPAL
jgi:hypothetical protein